MTDAVPTITILTENGPVDINISDFNPAIHKVAGSDHSADEAEVAAPKTGKGRK